MPKEKIQSYQKMFLYRQGLKLKPSENFVNKFKEIYNNLLKRHNKRNRCNVADIDDNTAIYFINSVFEAIIYCLDFGISIYLNKLVNFTASTRDYRDIRHEGKIVEDVKRVRVHLTSANKLLVKKNCNLENEEYKEFIELKKRNYKELLDYYRKAYGLDNESREDG